MISRSNILFALFAVFVSAAIFVTIRGFRERNLIIYESTLRITELERKTEKMEAAIAMANPAYKASVGGLRELPETILNESALDLPLPESGSILNGYENILIPVSDKKKK